MDNHSAFLNIAAAVFVGVFAWRVVDGLVRHVYHLAHDKYFWWRQHQADAAREMEYEREEAERIMDEVPPQKPAKKARKSKKRVLKG